jgi:hypothetical protein
MALNRPQHFFRSDVSVGSFTTKMGFPPDVRFSPPIATKLRTSPEVHFVPTGDIGKEKRPPIEETVVRRFDLAPRA